MSFRFSIGDFIAAKGLLRKIVDLLNGLSSPFLDELRVGTRLIQVQFETLNQYWTQSTKRSPPLAMLATMKRLVDSLGELAKLLERLEKISPTRKAHTNSQEIRKIQTCFSEIRELLSTTQSLISPEDANKVKTLVDPDQPNPNTDEAGRATSDTEKVDVPVQMLNKSSTSLSLAVHNLVLVHGLAAHARGTWTSVESCWFDDFYPRSFPGAHVSVYCYDSVALVNKNFTMNVVKEARNLIGFVTDYRNNAPVIFCTHGIGGFIVKTALIYAFHARLFDESCAMFIKHVRALVLYGLPDLSLPFALERHIEDLDRIGILRKTDFMRNEEGEMYCPSKFAFGDEDYFTSIAQDQKISVIYNFERLPVVRNDGLGFVTEPSINFNRRHVEFLDGNHFTVCQFQTEVDKNYRKLCQLVLAILTNCKSVKQCFQSSDLSRRQGDGEQKDQLFPGAETDTGENIKQRIIPLDNTDLKDMKMNYIERFRAFCQQLEPSMAQWRTPVMYKDSAWIESTPYFCSWNAITTDSMEYKERKLLLIRGSPGSGKSTLLYYLLNRFARYNQHGESVTRVVSHWCNRSYVQSLTFSCMVRSFLWQLLSLEETGFHTIYTTWLKLPEAPDKLLSLLDRVLKGLPNNSFLFLVDGIDSVEEDYEGLLMSMCDIFKTCASAKVIFTSGDEHGGNHIVEKLSEDINLSIIPLPYDENGLLLDTRNLVNDLIEDLTRSRDLPNTLRKEILDVTLSKSQGNFGWIVLLFQTLGKLRSVGRIKAILPCVSSDVFSLYDQLLAEQPEPFKRDFGLVCYTIQHSFEPLSPQELSTIIAILRSDDVEYVQRDRVLDLKSFLSPLVGPVINMDMGKVSFTHNSFSAYLYDPSFQTLHPHNHQDTHFTLAVTCVRWLEFYGSKIENSEELDFTHIPFLLYSARHWHQHCQRAVDPTNSLLPIIHEKILNLRPGFLQQVKSHAKLDLQIPGDDENILNFAAAIGLELTLEIIHKIDDKFDQNTATWDEQILRAFTNRHTSTLVQILKLTSERSFFRKLLVGALHKAKSSSIYEFSRFVIDLLKVTGSLNFDEDDLINDLALTPTILLLALRHRRWELAVRAYQTLYQSELTGSVGCADWKHVDGPNIFCEAISAIRHDSHEWLQVENFFALGLRLDLLTSSGETPLHFAVKSGFFSFINDSGTFVDNIDVANERGQTALHVAAEAGFLDTVRELTSLNADINARDHENITPLHLAALYGHNEVVKFLLSVGSSTNTHDKKGRTPLLIAAAADERTVVESLFRQGADLSQADDKGQTPLHLAAYNWSQTLATYIIQWCPSDINIRDNSGRSPLHATASRGLDGLAELLLSKGADPIALDDSGRSALHYAVESKYVSDSLMQLLVGHGNDPNLKDKENLSPIDLAQKVGNTIAVQRLRGLVDQPSISNKEIEQMAEIDSIAEAPAILSPSGGSSNVEKISIYQKPLDYESSEIWRTRPFSRSDAGSYNTRSQNVMDTVVSDSRSSRRYTRSLRDERNIYHVEDERYRRRRFRNYEAEIEIERLDAERNERDGRRRFHDYEVEIEMERLDAEKKEIDRRRLALSGPPFRL